MEENGVWTYPNTRNGEAWPLTFYKASPVDGDSATGKAALEGAYQTLGQLLKEMAVGYSKRTKSYAESMLTYGLIGGRTASLLMGSIGQDCLSMSVEIEHLKEVGGIIERGQKELKPLDLLEEELRSFSGNGALSAKVTKPLLAKVEQLSQENC